MSWLRVDDGFTRNQKVFDLSHQAFRLHVTALCHCAANLTDGEIRSSVLPMLLAESKVAQKYVSELVNAGLWVGIGPWKINHYLEYNHSREKVQDERRKAADRQARWRSNTVTDDVTNGVSNASPAQPSPIPEELLSVQGRLGPIDRLLEVLRDKDSGTKAVITSLVLELRLTEGDLEFARECATGKGVRSPTRVAVDALKKRGVEKAKSA